MIGCNSLGKNGGMPPIVMNNLVKIEYFKKQFIVQIHSDIFYRDI
jgi:hypothetical protein